jgi:uncharacterized peroxidase-related enzyme
MWIETIGVDAAQGRLREVYERIAKRRGKVSNIMAVQSLDPDSMEAHLELYLAVMFRRGGLSRAEREMVAVAVSVANGCDYCIRHHAEALQAYWKDADRVRMLETGQEPPDLSPRERAMVVHARLLTLAAGDVRRQHVDQLRSAGLQDEEVLHLHLVIGYFNFVNRLALGLGVEFSADEAAGYRY